MKNFRLYLQGSVQSEQFDNIVSFVGEDSSGSFGLQANHIRFMTCLKSGLARFQYNNGKIDYIALPGGILYFINNQLKIATRYYLRSDDYQKITNELDQKLLKEETDISNIRKTLHRLDENVLKRLWELQREGKQ